MRGKDKNLKGLLYIDLSLEVLHLDTDLGAILPDVFLGTAPILETILLEEQKIADLVDMNHHLLIRQNPQSLIVEEEDITREHFPQQKEKCLIVSKIGKHA